MTKNERDWEFVEGQLDTIATQLDDISDALVRMAPYRRARVTRSHVALAVSVVRNALEEAAVRGDE